MSVFNQPVRVGEVLDVEIEKEGDEGDGIAFVEGLAIFVSGASRGQEVTVKIQHVDSNYAVGDVAREW